MLYEWVKRVEVDSEKRVGIPIKMAEKVKALERENRERARRTRSFARRQC